VGGEKGMETVFGGLLFFLGLSLGRLIPVGKFKIFAEIYPFLVCHGFSLGFQAIIVHSGSMKAAVFTAMQRGGTSAAFLPETCLGRQGQRLTASLAEEHK